MERSHFSLRVNGIWLMAIRYVLRRAQSFGFTVWALSIYFDNANNDDETETIILPKGFVCRNKS